MRGKEDGRIDPAACVGIIPAYAGKSYLNSTFYNLIEDHPRVCGEKKVEPVFVIAVVGSSPRMRGKACKNFGNA